MQQVIITIPVYKSIMDKYETISYIRCLKILNNYPICIFTYKQNNLNIYKSIAKKYGVEIIVKYFDYYYFKDIQGYNQLMLTPFFYKQFNKYKYILIYQLDAYVFRDELSKWCDKNFSYIGAPIFEKYIEADENSKFIHAFNGGASLRNTKDFYQLLYLIIINEYLEKNYVGKSILKKIKTIKQVLIKDFSKQPVEQITRNEDIQFSIDLINKKKQITKQKKSVFLKIIYNLYNQNNYKLPDYESAHEFAFDENIKYLLSKYKIPFICHAWQRKNKIEIWSNYIEELKEENINSIL